MNLIFFVQMWIIQVLVAGDDDWEGVGPGFWSSACSSLIFQPRKLNLVLEDRGQLSYLTTIPNWPLLYVCNHFQWSGPYYVMALITLSLHNQFCAHFIKFIDRFLLNFACGFVYHPIERNCFHFRPSLPLPSPNLCRLRSQMKKCK